MERKRAGVDVAESKGDRKNRKKTQQLPQPHVLLKQLKQSRIPTHPPFTYAHRSKKRLWKHSRKMGLLLYPLSH